MHLGGHRCDWILHDGRRRDQVVFAQKLVYSLDPTDDGRQVERSVDAASQQALTLDLASDVIGGIDGPEKGYRSYQTLAGRSRQKLLAERL